MSDSQAIRKMFRSIMMPKRPPVQEHLNQRAYHFVERYGNALLDALDVLERLRAGAKVEYQTEWNAFDDWRLISETAVYDNEKEARDRGMRVEKLHRETPMGKRVIKCRVVRVTIYRHELREPLE